MTCCDDPNYETKTDKNGGHYRICTNCGNIKFGAVDAALRKALNTIFPPKDNNNELRIER